MEMPKKLYNFAVTFFRDYGRQLQAFTDAYFPPMDFGDRKTIGLNRQDLIGAPDPSNRENLIS